MWPDIRRKVIAQTGVFLFVLFIAFVYFFVQAEAILMRKQREVVQSIAAAGSLCIDPALVDAIKGRADEDSEAYRLLKSLLQEVRGIYPGIRYVYIMRATTTPGIVEFVVDAEEDPDLLSHAGDTYDTAQSPAILVALAGESVAEKHFTVDQWGKWLSGFAPITDDSGRVAGIIGVDLAADEVYLKIRGLLLDLMAMFVFTCVLGVGLIYVLVYRLGNRVDQLSHDIIDLTTELTSLQEVAASADAGSLDGITDRVLAAVRALLDTNSVELLLVSTESPAGNALPDVGSQALFTVSSLSQSGLQFNRPEKTPPEWMDLLSRAGLDFYPTVIVCAANGVPQAVLLVPTISHRRNQKALCAIARTTAVALSNVRSFLRLSHLATIDGLTGLYTHTVMQAKLDELHATGQNYVVVLLDVDDLGMINEAYGHAAGDQVLRAVGSAIAACLPEGSAGCRSGGDEFVLLLACDRQSIGLWYERFTKELDSFLGALSFPVYLSAGIGCYPTDGGTVNEVRQGAEEALRRAKRSGGNKMVMAGAVHTRMVSADVELRALLDLVTAVDNKDTYTLTHSEQVSALAVRLAMALDMSEGTVEVLRTAGLLHDVGKIAVPDAVLRKPAGLSPDEIDVIKRHPVFGSRLIHDIPGSREVAEAILYHHERWDGQGYPHKLSGENIPVNARILAVVDSYSAMTTDRPYRKALSHDRAVEELLLGAGTQYDPRIVNAFIKLM